MADQNTQDTQQMEKSDEEEEEEESDSDESEEEEPKLKYERVGNDLSDILRKDAASCMAVHEKFLALGTHWGMVHVLDHQGNRISSKEYAVHQTTVNQISLDQNGDNMASCSDDGKVAVHGLYSTDDNILMTYDCPIKAVALDPNFSRPNSGKMYVTGGDKLVLHEKGWLSRYKTSELHKGEGPIRVIKWRGPFIAWANDMGVKMYDTSSKKRITYIARDNTQLRPELYRCNMCWKDDTTLLIGWGDSIKICKVKERDPHDVRDLPNRYVEITAMFKLDFYVCGIAPLGDQLVVLAHVMEENEDGSQTSARPQLRILEPHMDTHEEISSDALSIRGFQEYRCNDYHLEYIEEDRQFFIVAPKDIVVAKLRDQDDHISWLMEHEMFEEALLAAEASEQSLKRHNVMEIGMTYINFLREEGQYDKAAEMCVKILGKNKELWEQEVFKFLKDKQLKAISPFIPRGDVRLKPAFYELVLNEFLLTDHEGFHQLIKDWSPDLYNIQVIINAVQTKLETDPQNKVLLRSLAELHTYDKRYDKALAIYLKLGHEDVFPLIHKHNLFSSIQDKIVMLMDFDMERAVRLLIDNLERIPIEKVVHQLEPRPKLLYLYLDTLFQKDPHIGQDFHALQVKLYAEFDRARLLPFLRSSNYYPLQKALEECQQRNFIPEMVFLLGRMGNTKQALHLITEELQDVDKAIEFAKEHDDEELWEDLISSSMDKPAFITGLLQNIGTHVDPIILIKRIPEGLEIPGLRDSLVKILQDFNLQISLREGCKKILVSDCYTLMSRLNRQQKRGLRVEESDRCESCSGPVLVDDSRSASNISVFYCHHVFHQDCLPYNTETCTLCNAQRRRPGSAGIFRK
ncbi:vacuolar protein sorting-associated protein 41 homolog isoform X2 [Branchiostoma floridae x Branchiostoma belcheri]